MSHLKELQDVMSDQEALDTIAAELDWERKLIARDGGSSIVEYTRPSSGLAVILIWTGQTLTRALHGTRVSKMEARADQFSAPELVKVAVMFLEENELGRIFS